MKTIHQYLGLLDSGRSPNPGLLTTQQRNENLSMNIILLANYKAKVISWPII